MADLDKIFAKAAEIAQKLPEKLQEAAFNRALDELLGGSNGEIEKKNPRSSERSKRLKQETKATENSADKLIDALDRTKYPDIGATNRMADRALKVLHLANEDHGVDGLTAAQIAEILTKKFRLPSKLTAVLMALQRESQTVDVRTGPDGQKLFHIMAPGEEYLEKLRIGEISPRTRRSKKSPTKKVAIGKNAISKNKPIEKTAQRKSTTLGPKAAIGKLIDAGYFGSPRQISEIQEELKHSKGHTFSVQDLSPALVRCVRDETLTRSRNESGQYEYSKT